MLSAAVRVDGNTSGKAIRKAQIVVGIATDAVHVVIDDRLGVGIDVHPLVRANDANFHANAALPGTNHHTATRVAGADIHVVVAVRIADALDLPHQPHPHRPSPRPPRRRLVLPLAVITTVRIRDVAVSLLVLGKFWRYIR